MIVGGIANAIWGEPQADVDVTVAVENPDSAHHHRTIRLVDAALIEAFVR